MPGSGSRVKINPPKRTGGRGTPGVAVGGYARAPHGAGASLLLIRSVTVTVVSTWYCELSDGVSVIGVQLCCLSVDETFVIMTGLITNTCPLEAGSGRDSGAGRRGATACGGNQQENAAFATLLSPHTDGTSTTT